MQTINSGTVRVFTFKEGLLSAIAHDLQLTVREFSVTIEDVQVTARFRANSIRVDGAVRDGRIDDRALKTKHQREIVDTIQRKILETRAHPEIVFQGRRDGMQVRGDLQMVGRSHGIEFTVTEIDGQLKGRVELKPRRWGIQPYSAMFGALKLQDRVVVEFEFDRA